MTVNEIHTTDPDQLPDVHDQGNWRKRARRRVMSQCAPSSPHRSMVRVNAARADPRSPASANAIAASRAFAGGRGRPASR